MFGGCNDEHCSCAMICLPDGLCVSRYVENRMGWAISHLWHLIGQVISSFLLMRLCVLWQLLHHVEP